MRVTVDASVAVKWLVAEDHRKEARALLGPRIERYAPDLLPVECASAILKKARRGEIGSAASFLDEIAKLSGVIRVQPGETLLREATETALRIGHPVYDSLYIACARRTGSVLVTADRKLFRVVSDRVPDVEAIALQDDREMARVEAASDRNHRGRSATPLPHLSAAESPRPTQLLLRDRIPRTGWSAAHARPVQRVEPPARRYPVPTSHSSSDGGRDHRRKEAGACGRRNHALPDPRRCSCVSDRGL